MLALDRRLDRGLEQSRNLLIAHLVSYRQAKSLNLTVVFEGWRSGSANQTSLVQNGITIVYSRLGEKADGVIIRLAREKNSGAMVVSSDREIRRAVERFGAVAIHAQEFNEILHQLVSRALPMVLRIGEISRPIEPDPIAYLKLSADAKINCGNCEFSCVAVLFGFLTLNSDQQAVLEDQ